MAQAETVAQQPQHQQPMVRMSGSLPNTIPGTATKSVNPYLGNRMPLTMNLHVWHVTSTPFLLGDMGWRKKKSLQRSIAVAGDIKA